ncbi:MAG: tRNA (adenosine(37)-N6)-threonylcarbamoyltransferase complex ATPase subunit type 1 TsaE [Bacteroidota bacterium]
MSSFTTESPGETLARGEAFAEGLRGGDVVALTGELGSGKTLFVRGVCRGLGVGAEVTSPTFTLVHEYRGEDLRVIHADLYRLEGEKEAAELGLEEYFAPDCVCLIEWAEKAHRLLPPGHYRVRIRHGEREDVRVFAVERIGGPPNEPPGVRAV